MSDVSISALNRKIEHNPVAVINEAEERYHSFVREVADRVTKNDKIRIILLAGPSGSGKTTTANLLSDYIKERGFTSRVISLDDFYRDSTDPEYPKQPSGERDYEALGALHLPDLVEMLNDIARGDEYYLPRYDFKTTRRVSVERCEPITHGCVIIEGLHALNPKIFTKLPSEKLLKIFISVSTNVCKNGERLVSGRKLRFVRRMVRDNIFRASDAKRTYSMWQNVLKGENKYLYPNRDYADVSFDTFHAFELSLMREFAEGVISDELAERYTFLDLVRSALREATPIDPELVPSDSLMREFISGGRYEKLY